MLPQASEILQGCRFYGNILILYHKGQEILTFEPEEYIEVTEKYIYFSEATNTENAQSVLPVVEKSKVLCYLDDEPLDELPHIEFDRAYDNIVCNGTVICADYIEDYYGSLGFFWDGLEGAPLAFWHGVTSPVYIYWKRTWMVELFV